MSALSMETFTAGVDTAQEAHQVVTPTVTQEQVPFYLLVLLATASAVVNSKAILGAAVFKEMPRGQPLASFSFFILFLLLDRGLEGQLFSAVAGRESEAAATSVAGGQCKVPWPPVPCCGSWTQLESLLPEAHGI